MKNYSYAQYLLEHYRQIIGYITLLEEELATFQEVMDDDVIAAIALGRSSGGSQGSRGRISDKTGNIALIYREATERLNSTSKQEIKCQIGVYRGEIRRLELALDSLPLLWKGVLSGLYIEGKTYMELEDDLCISQRTISRYRQKGLDMLEEILAWEKDLGVCAF